MALYLMDMEVSSIPRQHYYCRRHPVCDGLRGDVLHPSRHRQCLRQRNGRVNSNLGCGGEYEPAKHVSVRHGAGLGCTPNPTVVGTAAGRRAGCRERARVMEGGHTGVVHHVLLTDMITSDHEGSASSAGSRVPPALQRLRPTNLRGQHGNECRHLRCRMRPGCSMKHCGHGLTCTSDNASWMPGMGERQGCERPAGQWLNTGLARWTEQDGCGEEMKGAPHTNLSASVCLTTLLCLNFFRRLGVRGWVHSKYA